MDSTNTKQKRACVKPMYCDQVTANAVNEHVWFNDCVNGNERAERLLLALDFSQENYGKEPATVTIPTNNSELENRIAQLESELQNRTSELEQLQQQYNDDIATHQARIDELLATPVTVDTASGEWETVKSLYDPAYTAVVEEVANRLSERYQTKVHPHAILMTFFMKYYYNQDVEFDGMPFVMRPAEILKIVQQVYPEMTGRVLSRALSV